MKPKLIHCGLAALAGMAAALGALGGALAQTATPGIDLDAIRARAASNAGEADALAATARARAKAITTEASQSAEDGKANGQRYAGMVPHRAAADAMFDFDKMVADAGDMAMQGMGEAPRFIAFASLSMPQQALRQMIDDVTRAGGVIAFRGLTRGSAKVMTDALGKVLKPGERMNGVGIDPRLFRAFEVTEVPAYIVTASDFDLCSGFDCSSEVPPFDRMTGNVTARFALETFSEGGGPSARIARQHLAHLERQDP